MGAETGPERSPSDADGAFWARVREHKVIQWGIAYLGAAACVSSRDSRTSCRPIRR
jgi:hypothetical protein